MFFINPFAILFEFSFAPFLFGAFGLFGLMLCLRKLIMGR